MAFNLETKARITNICNLIKQLIKEKKNASLVLTAPKQNYIVDPLSVFFLLTFGFNFVLNQRFIINQPHSFISENILFHKILLDAFK